MLNLPVQRNRAHGFSLIEIIVVITIIGGIYFVRLGLHFRDLRAAPEQP